MSNKWRRLGLAAGGVLLTIFLLGVFVLPSFVGPVIVTAAAERDVDLEIDSLRVGLLSGRVVMRGVTVANPPGYTDSALASLEACTINARVLPLMRQEIVVQTVSLKRATLNVERRAEGEINLVALMNQLSGPESADPDEADGATDAAAPPAEFRVGRVVGQDLTLRWTDRAVGEEPAELILEDVQVRIRDLYSPMAADRQDTTFTITARLAGAGAGDIRVEGKGNFLQELLNFEMTVTLDGVTVTAFTPYTATAPLMPTGGTATGTVEAVCVDDQLDAAVLLTLADFGLQANPAAKAPARLSSSMLSGLGNLDDTKEISLRISGNVRDPKFHAVSAIMFALMREITGDLAPGIFDAGQTAVGKVGESIGSLFDRMRNPQ